MAILYVLYLNHTYDFFRFDMTHTHMSHTRVYEFLEAFFNARWCALHTYFISRPREVNGNGNPFRRVGTTTKRTCVFLFSLCTPYESLSTELESASFNCIYPLSCNMFLVFLDILKFSHVLQKPVVVITISIFHWSPSWVQYHCFSWLY